MSDPGTRYTDKKVAAAEKRLRALYDAAARDIVEKLNEHNQRFREGDALRRGMVAAGKMTQEAYEDWVRRQMLTEKTWKDKLNSAAIILLEANKQAARIVDGERRAVFGENATYQAFQMEHDAGLDLSFTVYDSATVTRILRDRPELMPRRIVNGERDKAWNRDKMAAIIGRGIVAGLSIPDIAKRIAEETATANEKAAVRYARTAMTAAQNAGRMEALHEAQEMGIEVRKVWLATLDERTRDAHQELDGQVQKVDDPFDSILGPIMYPGDPGADDANVWNCRCTLTYEYKEYPQQNAMRYDQLDGVDIEDISYVDWKAAKTSGATETAPEMTLEEKLRQLLASDDPDIYEVGKLFSQLMHEAFEPYKKDAEDAKKALEELDFDYSANAIKEAHRLLSMRTRLSVYGGKDIDLSDIREMLENAGINTDGYGSARELLSFLSDKNADISIRKAELRDKMNSLNGTQSAQLLKDNLAKFRTMGSDGINITEHLNNSRSNVRLAVERAYDYYPKSWVQASIDRGNLTPRAVSRGYYSDWSNVIAISGDALSRQITVAIHELGHRFERAVPAIKKDEATFYDKRTAGQSLEWLGPGYKKSEITRKDDFLTPYMGKDYGGSAYELVSMGFQYAYTEPLRLEKDSDMESWIYGILLTR